MPMAYEPITPSSLLRLRARTIRKLAAGYKPMPRQLQPPYYNGLAFRLAIGLINN
jgi:hypothetical protein